MSRWLEGDGAAAAKGSSARVAFDNSYEWLGAMFRELMSDPVCARRPQYVWGMLQGVVLAAVLDYEEVSAIEFGVAAGAGLIVLERIVEHCMRLSGLRIQVYGFDTGTGYPKPADYRDMPYRWFEGYYPCDKGELQRRLRGAQMIYGLIGETVDTFVRTPHAPVAFVGWDLNCYTGTRDALRLYEGDPAGLLPRVPCSFRSAVGKDCCDFTGELLAISEFNTAHADRKISSIPGLDYLVSSHRGHWIGMMRSFHVFDHPRYGQPQSRTLSAIIDIDGRETQVDSRFGSDLANARAQAGPVKANSQ